MKGFNLTGILHQVKEKEKENKKIDRMINHLLPTDVEELNKCIAINNIFDTDY